VAGVPRALPLGQPAGLPLQDYFVFGIRVIRAIRGSQRFFSFSETLLSFFLCKGTNPQKGKTYELHD
jgi:hypothetical protein